MKKSTILLDTYFMILNQKIIFFAGSQIESLKSNI